MIFTLWKKEVDAYFSSPLAFVLIGLFSLISGIIFFNLLVTYTDGIQALPPNYTEQISFVEEVVLKFFANVNFLFLVFIPLITMKLFSEEIRQETLDLYWLSPIKEWELVLSKTLAAFPYHGCFPVSYMGSRNPRFSFIGNFISCCFVKCLCLYCSWTFLFFNFW